MRSLSSILVRRHLWVGVLLGGLLLPAWGNEADPLSNWLAERGWGQPEAPSSVVNGLEEQHKMRLSSLVVHSLAYLDTPYRFGGNSLAEGLDCSGFVQAAFRHSLGVQLPRRTVDQAHATQFIERQQLVPGDLVFFNTLGAVFSHVGIYVGQGRFVHSPRSGARIRMERMDNSYWGPRFTGARRVALPPLTTVAAAF